MRSDLFVDTNREVEGAQRFARQNSQLLRVALGPGSPDVLATKGSMVAYQGQVRFDHEGSGGVGRFLKKVLTNEDLPLMRVSGSGEVFFAQSAGFVYLVDLEQDALARRVGGVGRARAELRDLRVARGVRVVDEEAAVRRELRVEGEPEQPALAHARAHWSPGVEAV